MALKKSINLLEITGLDVDIPDCYIKIDQVKGDKVALTVYVSLRATKEAEPLHTKRLTFKPSVSEGSGNFIAQAYEHLKTLPEFADAVDC